MSSNSLAIRLLRLAPTLAALSLAACATPKLPGLAKADGPVAKTPTEQYQIQVSRADDVIRLAPHESGLSQAQSDALGVLVGRWRDQGHGPIEISTPQNGGAPVFRAAAKVEEALAGLGVAGDDVRVASYAGDAGAPITVGFTHYEAKGPDCGTKWASMTHTASNGTYKNFGCATTANLAALVADPGDLVAPATVTAPDAERRETVLTKYRQGATTSTAKDSQASGAVSSVGQQ